MEEQLIQFETAKLAQKKGKEIRQQMGVVSQSVSSSSAQTTVNF